ncbi:outer membrane autotransporter barrel domain-containing protein, partial [Brucella sp. 83/13]
MDYSKVTKNILYRALMASSSVAALFLSVSPVHSAQNIMIDHGSTRTFDNTPWNVRDDTIFIGGFSSGTMLIRNGSNVFSKNSYIGPLKTSVGTVEVLGGGSLLEASLRTIVGFHGVGTLKIENGGKVTTPEVSVASAIGSRGVVEVSDGGSLLEIKGDFYVGGASTATMTIKNGGRVSSSVGNISAIDTSSSVVTVSGNGSIWENKILQVGQFGTGTLNIENGGRVSSSEVAAIGAVPGSTGVVTVSGNGSILENTSRLFIGAGGNGTLNIENGGKVSNTIAAIAANSGSNGTVTLSGIGSLWDASVHIYLGGQSTGTLNIGAAPNEAPIAAGTLKTPLILFGNGTGDGTLNFRHDGILDFSVPMASNGDGTYIINHSAGITILTGDSSAFTGRIIVSDGTLRVGDALGNGRLNGTASVTSTGIFAVDGIFAGSVSGSAGGTVTGVGTIGGNVEIADGGILSPGASPGTLTINGNLTLSNNSVLDYEFGQANVAGGPVNDLINVGGDLTLDGILNITASPGAVFDPGLYRIFNYNGTLIDNGLTIGAIASAGALLQTSVANQVNIINTAGLALEYWDGEAGRQFDAIISGGDGVWQAGADNSTWADKDGLVNVPFKNDAFAIFSGASGIVTVDNTQGAVTTSGMQFIIDGYVIQGGEIGLAGNEAAIRVGDGTIDGATTKATITSALTGASKLVKSDFGTLTLSGANTYSGGTMVKGGTLSVAADSNLGAATGSLSFDGGTLLTTADFMTSRVTTLEAGGGTFNMTGATTLFHAGAIDGVGALTKAGAGTLSLNGQSSYAGATIIDEGTLSAGGENYLSATSDFSVGNNAVLALNSFNQRIASLHNSGRIDFGPSTSATLTVAGDYVGYGGTLLVSTALGDDSSAIDRLLVTGNASGFTTLAIRNAGGTGALTSEGIKIVDVDGTSDATFTLAGNMQFQGAPAIISGAYIYQLYKNGMSTPEDGDWYLRSTYQPGA